MSKPNSPNELFPRSDPSGDFGRDEGMVGYSILANEHPDWPVEKIAKQAVRLQMIISQRFDVHDTRAIEAIVRELEAGLDTSIRDIG